MITECWAAQEATHLVSLRKLFRKALINIPPNISIKFLRLTALSSQFSPEKDCFKYSFWILTALILRHNEYAFIILLGNLRQSNR